MHAGLALALMLGVGGGYAASAWNISPSSPDTSLFRFRIVSFFHYRY
jgi:hypothetical protein